MNRHLLVRGIAAGVAVLATLVIFQLISVSMLTDASEAAAHVAAQAHAPLVRALTDSAPPQCRG
jgi:hypothetical protein